MTQDVDFHIDNETLFEPATTTENEEETQPSIEVPEEVIQQGLDAYQEHLQSLIDKFGETELKEYFAILENFEAYANECEKRSREATRKNELLDPNEDPIIDYKDPRTVQYNTKVASAIKLLEQANKLPEEFVRRAREAENKCFVAQTRVLSVTSLEGQMFNTLTQQVDQALLQGVYTMAAFQFENVVRTLQNLRREGVLDDNAIDQYILNLEKLRDLHMNYLEFHELPVDILLDQYGIVLEVIGEIRADNNHSNLE